MKILTNILASLFLLAIGVGGLLIFGEKPKVPTKEAETVQAALVETAAVTDWDGPFDVNVDGEAVTYRVVSVGAEVEGRIVRKTQQARGGTYVRQGELLLQIDPQNYRLEVERLEAMLTQTDEELRGIDVELANTESLTALAKEQWQLQKNHLDRMRQLQDRRTANDTEVETAMREELASRNSLQSLNNQQQILRQNQRTKQAGRTLVESQLKRARLDVDRCDIHAPLDGRIVDDVIEEGDHTKFGQVLIRISDGSRMEVKCQLRAEELAWVWQQSVPENDGSDRSVAADGNREEQTAGGTGIGESRDPVNLPSVPCEVAFDFEGVETIWDGYLSRLEGSGIDRETRTFPCRVLVDEPLRTRINDSAGGKAVVTPPALLSGMYVSIRIPVESPLPLLRVPIEAVRPGGQVWLADGDRLLIRQVVPAHVERDFVLLRRDGSGLRSGDRVVVSPLAAVWEGMSVTEADRAAHASAADSSAAVSAAAAASSGSDDSADHSTATSDSAASDSAASDAAESGNAAAGNADETTAVSRPSRNDGTSSGDGP
ncbi:MAG: hypothetical protein KDA89_01125 [Planctomycetaceae bacterium]|nr:hypothetical protein [Planctomycetaceae bacterium]